MTIIAYDGTVIAADRMTTNCGMSATVTKIFKHGDTVYAGTGELDGIHMLMDWHKNGADPDKWPERQKTEDDWTRLIVAYKDKVIFYERHPVYMVLEDEYMAWGSGRDFAMGALAMGADAKKAVEIASLHSIGCGNGIDCFEL